MHADSSNGLVSKRDQNNPSAKRRRECNRASSNQRNLGRVEVNKGRQETAGISKHGSKARNPQGLNILF